MAGRMRTCAAGAAAASVKVRRGGPMLPRKKGCWDGPEEVAVLLDELVMVERLQGGCRCKFKCKEGEYRSICTWTVELCLFSVELR